MICRCWSIFWRKSDKSGLSDNSILIVAQLVRFLTGIRQVRPLLEPGCPIPPKYRTIAASTNTKLSDKQALSDNSRLDSIKKSPATTLLRGTGDF